MEFVRICAEGRGTLLRIETPRAGLRSRLPDVKEALVRFSGFLGEEVPFGVEAVRRGSDREVRLTGGLKDIPNSLTWAAWVTAGALGDGAPPVFAGVVGLDALSLPAEELDAAVFPPAIDKINLGIPHAGLRNGVLKLIGKGKPLRGEVLVGTVGTPRGPLPGAVFARLAEALFLDPTAVSLQRPADGAPILRISTRPLPVKPFALPAYALAVRGLLIASMRSSNP